MPACQIFFKVAGNRIYQVNLMSETGILTDIKNDIAFLKEKLLQFEVTVNEIDNDFHRETNPEYVKVLDEIEKEDRRIRFRDLEDFDRHFGG
jgi:hypothetical protein